MHFMTSEDTIAKRIYRAKEKIKEEQLSIEDACANLN